MREILFRARTISEDEYMDSDEWVEGYLTRRPSAIQYGKHYSPWFIDRPPVDPDDSGASYNVDGSTIGQFTGLTDKNGKRIFEGDIVTGLFLFGMSVNAVVTFQDGAFGLEWHRGNAKTFNAFTSICNVEYEVIGNIHDNPDLLKEAEA